MIPENKKAAVESALQAAFGVNNFENIRMLTQGLSSALIFRIEVSRTPYLLRVITKTDAMADPGYYFERMKAGAAAGLAPAIHYLSVEDRISITDFINAKPFPLATARTELADTISKLHALPKFPFRINYLNTMDAFISKFLSEKIVPAEFTDEVFERYERIKKVYPPNDEGNLVSCHNDLKPENVLFDGRRAWLVDWEAAFLNDRYVDLAVVGNFVVTNEREEVDFLERYFGERVDGYRQARFFLMTQMMHVFYFAFFIRLSCEGKPIDVGSLKEHDYRAFHNGIWSGEIEFHVKQPKLEYGWVHRNQFLKETSSDRFEESIKRVSEFAHAV